MHKGNSIYPVEKTKVTRRKKSSSPIKNWIKQYLNISQSEEFSYAESSILDEHFHLNCSIQFTVYIAKGGQVIESRKYDKNIGDYISSLTVVKHGDSLGDAVEKILVVEGLR